MMKILTGLVITLLGLALFFVGVNVGYMPIAYLLGIKMVTSYKALLVPLGIIIGFVIVKAEPAVAVLTEQIEKITQGQFKSIIFSLLFMMVAIPFLLQTKHHTSMEDIMHYG